MRTIMTVRNIATLDAAARLLVPPGGTIPPGATDLGLTDKIVADVATWPRHVQWRIRALLTTFELLPLASGHRRPFSRLAPDDQQAFFTTTYRHRWAPRRFLATLMKQLCLTMYVAQPEVEAAIGYRYTCLRSREGVEATAEEQIHH